MAIPVSYTHLFANQFLLNFGDNVQLISFISSKKNIQDYHFDFLISTINDYESPDCMVISPLLDVYKRQPH